MEGTFLFLHRRVGGTLISILRGRGMSPHGVSTRPHDSRLSSALHFAVVPHFENSANIARRHEGALRHRSSDLKEATTAARYTAVQNGTQGTHVPAWFLYMFQYAVTIPPLSCLQFDGLPLLRPCCLGPRFRGSGEAMSRSTHVTRFERDPRAVHGDMNRTGTHLLDIVPCFLLRSWRSPRSAPLSGVVLTIPDQQRDHRWRRRPGLLDLYMMFDCQTRPASHAKASKISPATECDVTVSRRMRASTPRQGCAGEAQCDNQKLAKRYHIDEGMKQVNNTWALSFAALSCA